MGRQSIGISFQNNEVYECGAQLLAVLAHPVDDKDDVTENGRRKRRSRVSR